MARLARLDQARQTRSRLDMARLARPDAMSHGVARHGVAGGTSSCEAPHVMAWLAGQSTHRLIAARPGLAGKRGGVERRPGVAGYFFLPPFFFAEWLEEILSISLNSGFNSSKKS